MKFLTTLFIILMLFSQPGSLVSQQVILQGSYGGTNYNKFKSSFGYSLGYRLSTKKSNCYNFSVAHLMNQGFYIHQFSPTGAPFDDLIQDVTPFNHLIKLSANYGKSIINKENVGLFVGPSLSLNYYFIREDVDSYDERTNESHYYYRTDNIYNRLGIGAIMSAEIKKIPTNKISLIIDIVPELTAFGKFLVKGGKYPSLIAWLNIRIGLAYKHSSE